MDWFDPIAQFFADGTGGDWVEALFIFALGLVLARVLSGLVGRIPEEYLGRHQRILARRTVFYILVALALITALHQLGLRLGVLLGAAGILSVAIGFASQTSASNLISGLFLVAERPFVIGDYVTVNGITGEVVAIDLLSVKLRTWDNLFVRVPNETMMKTELTNLFHYPVRRLDTRLRVSLREDLDRVDQVLREVAEQHEALLTDPEPLVLFQSFGESGVEIQYSVWYRREDFVEVLSTVRPRVKAALDRAGIRLQVPYRSLEPGPGAEPFPVRVVGPDTPNTPSPERIRGPE